MNQNFVKTSDPNVADELRKNGFTELPKQGSMFCFVNNGKINFSEEDKKRILYTNNISI